MSLDGTFLHCVVSEMLSAGLVGGRIDKIYQPSREEIIISIRSAGKHNKILIYLFVQHITFHQIPYNFEKHFDLYLITLLE